MGNITFTPTIRGGNGNWVIKCPEGTPPVINFDQDHQNAASMTLAAGKHTLRISGQVPQSAGGNIHLKISGNVDPVGDQDFSNPNNNVPPFPLPVMVNA